jgi:hypothetical protein
MNRILMALLAMASLTACTTTPMPRSYLTPSEALNQAATIDGTRVAIGGVVDLGTNSRCLYDSRKAIRDRKGDGARVITLSAGDRLLERRADLNHRFVIVTGRFKRDFNEPGMLDLYRCNDAGIEQDSIQIARP